MSTLLSFAPEVDVSEATEDTCCDGGKMLYSSAYRDERVHEIRLLAGAQRCCCIEMNGALNPGDVIESVEWRSVCGAAATLTPRGQHPRKFGFRVAATDCGTQTFEARVMLASGDVSIQRVVVWVQ